MCANTFLRVRISSESLLLLVALITLVSLGEFKPMDAKNLRVRTNGAAANRNRLLHDNLGSKRKIERSDGNVANRDACIGHCADRIGEALTGTKQLCPYESKELCLIFSLSKIAKVQVGPSSRTLTDRIVESSDPDIGSMDAKNPNSRGDSESGLSVELSKRKEGDHFVNPLGGQARPRDVYCRAIQDVYIPEVKRNLPAFACKLGNNTFVLSSERFLQDRRTRLDIKIDEDILRNKKVPAKIAKNSGYGAIPALLVLNAATNDYRIEMRNAVPRERTLSVRPRGIDKQLSND